MKNNKQRIGSSILVSCIAVFFALAALSCSKDKARECKKTSYKKHHHNKMNYMMEQLGVNEEQKKSIMGIYKEYQGKKNGLKENMKQKKENYHTLLKNKASMEELKVALNEKMALKTEKELAKIEKMRSIRSQLNPEQQIKFDKMMEEKMAKWHHDKKCNKSDCKECHKKKCDKRDYKESHEKECDKRDCKDCHGKKGEKNY